MGFSTLMYSPRNLHRAPIPRILSLPAIVLLLMILTASGTFFRFFLILQELSLGHRQITNTELQKKNFKKGTIHFQICSTMNQAIKARTLRFGALFVKDNLPHLLMQCIRFDQRMYHTGLRTSTKKKKKQGKKGRKQVS